MSIIRRVPESMKTAGPEAAYTPCLVGLGPYHHFHPELYKMEGFKLAAAKSGLQRFNIPDFRALVGELRPLIPRIQACYDGALFSPEFEWAMAVDGLFLLSLLCDGLLLRLGQSPAAAPFFFHVNAPSELTVARKIMLAASDFRKYLRPPSGTVHPRQPATFPQPDMISAAVLNDAFLLENQIPIMLFAEAVVTFEPAVHRLVADNLDPLCRFLSPVQLRSTPGNSSNLDLTDGTPFSETHLLGYLYLMITGGDCDGEIYPTGSGTFSVAVDGGRLDVHNEILQQRIPGHLSSSAATGKPGDNAGSHVLNYILRKLAGFLLAVVGRMLSFGLLDYFIPGTTSNEARTNPTATQLRRIGLRFEVKSLGGGPTIEFDEETRTVAVPAFRWHPYCNVVTRNLLAYEATVAKSCRPSVLAEYVGFLHMVARTRRDVEVLIETGVVVLVDGDYPVGGNAGVTMLMQFFRSLHMVKNDEVVDHGGDDIIMAYEAVKSYYNSRPQVVAGGGLMTLGYFFALVVLYSAEVFAAAVVFVSVACGLLKNFAGCTVDSEGSCAANVTAGLMSAVGHGNSRFFLDG